MQEDLVTKNIMLVHYLANKYINKFNVPYSLREDIRSAGFEGLVKASKTFNSDKGVQFSTYASNVILNEMRMLSRIEFKQKKNSSLCSQFENEDGDENSLWDLLESPEHSPEEKYLLVEMLEDTLNIILNRLSKKERATILWLSAGLSQKKVGETLGIEQSYVSRLYRHSKEKIKKIYRIQSSFWGQFSVNITEKHFSIAFTPSGKEEFQKMLAILQKCDLKNHSFEVSKEQIIIKLFPEIESFDFLADVLYQL